MKYQLRYSNNIHRIMASNLIESLWSAFPFYLDSAFLLHFSPVSRQCLFYRITLIN